MDFKKKDLENILEGNFLWKFGFLFYIMGPTEIDFPDIAHVKVEVIALQKM